MAYLGRVLLGRKFHGCRRGPSKRQEMELLISMDVGADNSYLLEHWFTCVAIFWIVFKEDDLMAMLPELRTGELPLFKLNFRLNTLLPPKKENKRQIQQYM